MHLSDGESDPEHEEESTADVSWAIEAKKEQN